MGGVAALGVGATFTGLGLGLTIEGFSKSSSIDAQTGAGLTMLIGGAISLLSAPFLFLLPGDLESLAKKTRPLAAAGDRAAMERLLEDDARTQRRWRIGLAIGSFAAAAAIIPIGVASILSNGSLDESSRFDAGAAVGIVDTMLIGYGVAQLIRPSVAESVNRAWWATRQAATFRLVPSLGPQRLGVNVIATF